MSGDHNMHQKPRSYLDDFDCPRCGHCCHVEEEHRNTLRQAAQRAVEVMDAHMMRADTDEFYEAKEALRQALETDLARVGDVGVWGEREWVGLTDGERHGIREWQRIQEELGPVWAPMMLYLYEAIEAKLKEKNA